MSVKKRHTTVTRLLHVWMILDLIHARVSLGTLEMDITVAIQRRDPALKSGITSAQSAGSMSLIQMVRKVWHLLLCFVTCFVSRDSTKMTYWGGASPGSGKCACGMTNSCANIGDRCNCDKKDYNWRQDSGLLTDKTKLPVKQLRFGDTGDKGEKGYHTLGKLKCYGTA